MVSRINRDDVQNVYGVALDNFRDVNTKNGPKAIAHGEPSKVFWATWKVHKEALKALGFSVSKYDDAWQVAWWVDREDSKQGGPVGVLPPAGTPEPWRRGSRRIQGKKKALKKMAKKAKDKKALANPVTVRCSCGDSIRYVETKNVLGDRTGYSLSCSPCGIYTSAPSAREVLDEFTRRMAPVPKVIAAIDLAIRGTEPKPGDDDETQSLDAVRAMFSAPPR